MIVNHDYVDKIFGSLDYEFVHEYGFRENVIHSENSDYSREAAAHIELQRSSATIELTPEFHGSYFISVETLVENSGCLERHTRQVLLLLMEYIRGETLSDIQPRALRSGVRSAILEKVSHAECVLANVGISHNDYCPRNIIILQFDFTDPHKTPEDIETHVKLKIIDFNTASVDTHPNCEYYRYRMAGEAKRRRSQPQLPLALIRYEGQLMNSYGWASMKEGEAEKWLWQQFRDDKRFRPVIWNPGNVCVALLYAGKVAEDNNSSDSGIRMETENEEKDS